MTFYEILKSVGVPAFYGVVTEDDIKPPFLIYLFGMLNTFKADNLVYEENPTYTVELYFNQKDLDLEQRLKSKISEYGYTYDQSEDVWIDGENMFVTYFDIW